MLYSVAKVDKIGRVFVICGGNAVNYFISNDLKHLAVIPYLIEIGKQSTGKDSSFTIVVLITLPFRSQSQS